MYRTINKKKGHFDFFRFGSSSENNASYIFSSENKLRRRWKRWVFHHCPLWTLQFIYCYNPNNSFCKTYNVVYSCKQDIHRSIKNSNFSLWNGRSDPFLLNWPWHLFYKPKFKFWHTYRYSVKLILEMRILFCRPYKIISSDCQLTHRKAQNGGGGQPNSFCHRQKEF